MKTILLAVQDTALAAGFHAALQGTRAWQVLPPAHCFADTRAALVRHAPDLLVADLNLRDGSAIGLIRVLQLRQPAGRVRAQVLVLAAQESDPLLLDALQAGADNFFLTSGAEPQSLAVRVRETLAGGADIAPWIARRLLDHFGVGAGRRASLRDGQVEDMNNPLALTMDERSLLCQLSLGDRLVDLARQQGVQPRDLTSRVRDIYRKMQWALHAGNLRLT
jgi:DNA-binding NarL/FixJ family response regulator